MTEADLAVSRFLIEKTDRARPLLVSEEKSLSFCKVQHQRWECFWATVHLMVHNNFIVAADKFSVLIALIQQISISFLGAYRHAPNFTTNVYHAAKAMAYKIDTAWTKLEKIANIVQIGCQSS